jgi:hypothetical protein
MRKSFEDVTTPAGTRLPLCSQFDGILAEAAFCMCCEVASRGPVGFVLKAPNTSYLICAILCSTSEEVADTAIVPLDLYVGFEKCIYCGPPGFLGHRCELK